MEQLSMFEDNEAWHTAPVQHHSVLGVVDEDTMMIVDRQLDGGATITIRKTGEDDEVISETGMELTADTVAELVRYLKRKDDPNE